MEPLKHTPAQRLAALEERARFMRWLLARVEAGLQADLEDFVPGRGDDFWRTHLRYLISTAKELRAAMAEDNARLVHAELRYNPDGTPREIVGLGGVVKAPPAPSPGPDPHVVPESFIRESEARARLTLTLPAPLEVSPFPNAPRTIVSAPIVSAPKVTMVSKPYP